ncbi:MAG TPA: F0F1 ATP synthase subunit epsilon [Chloroflexota bacterium]|nr:F0F1 ATP synthase subunit epsilon [Chloroflexota bacterium]
MPKLTVELVTAEREVLKQEADIVIAPATDGTIGILPRHAPLVTTLNPGVMTLRNDGEEQVLSVSGGFLQVFRDRVLILADAAERSDEVDEERADAARQRAEAALREAQRRPGGSLQAEAARTALRRSLVRLDVVRRRKRRANP